MSFLQPADFTLALVLSLCYSLPHLQTFGCKSVQVEEIYSLDDDTFAPLKPILGLIFLFKWQGRASSGGADAGAAPVPEADDVFFCRQVINNACGTIALLHVVLNREDAVDVGDKLRDFKSFVSSFPADLRGSVLEQAEEVRVAHNSFAHPEPFEIQQRKARKGDDVFHFVAYTVANGRCWELDGLAPAPKPVGPPLSTLGPDADWISLAREALSSRIAAYSASEIKFNLLAVTRNRADVALAELVLLQERAQEAYAVLMSMTAEGDGDSSASGAGGADGAGGAQQPQQQALPPSPEEVLAEELPHVQLPPDVSAAAGSDYSSKPFALAEEPASLRAQYTRLCGEMRVRAALIAEEAAKREAWQVENARRRHNFVPFILQLLRELADRDALKPLLEAGQKTAGEALARERARRQAAAAAERADKAEKEKGAAASAAASSPSPAAPPVP